MATSPEFREYILDLLMPHVEVTARNMFGGVGIYANGIMFALITSEDVLYFKSDEMTRPDFVAAEMEPFGNMPYYQVPADVMESDELLADWVAKAVAASKRIAQKKKKKK